jgi:predicted TPR repeat methyltransferase
MKDSEYYKKTSTYQTFEIDGGRDFYSQDKENLLELERLQIPRKSVLDVGCCYGYFLRSFYYRGADRLVGIDIVSENVVATCTILSEDCKDASIEIVQGNFLENRIVEVFDFVVMLSVSHYLGDVNKLALLVKSKLNDGCFWIWEGIDPSKMDEAAKKAGFKITFSNRSNREGREIRHYKKG